jgi:hypothetical protein
MVTHTQLSLLLLYIFWIVKLSDISGNICPKYWEMMTMKQDFSINFQGKFNIHSTINQKQMICDT